MFTAKIICTAKAPNQYSPGAVQATFSPDYTQGRNKEWAAATPSLVLNMVLAEAASGLVEVGDRITLTFEKDEPVDSDAQV